MLYNNKLLNILRIVQKKLEAANEKVPKEITRMTLLCQKEDFSSTEFKETADKCYKKLVELSSGGYLYFPNAIQRSHFLGLLQNHAKAAFRCRVIAEDYNRCLPSANFRAYFVNKWKVSRIGVLNAKQRESGSINPVFGIDNSGYYYAILVEKEVYAIVPVFGYAIDPLLYGVHGMKDVFEFSEYKQGNVYSLKGVDNAALFNSSWNILEKGALRVGLKGKAAVVAPKRIEASQSGLKGSPVKGSPNQELINKLSSPSGPYSHGVFGYLGSGIDHGVIETKGPNRNIKVYSKNDQQYLKIFSEEEDLRGPQFMARVVGEKVYDGFTFRLIFKDRKGDNRRGSHTDYTLLVPENEIASIKPIIILNLDILIKVFQKVFTKYDRSEGKLCIHNINPYYEKSVLRANEGKISIILGISPKEAKSEGVSVDQKVTFSYEILNGNPPFNINLESFLEGRYFWAHGYGPVLEKKGEIPHTSYSRPGQYVLKATVKDSNKNTASGSINFKIREKGAKIEEIWMALQRRYTDERNDLILKLGDSPLFIEHKVDELENHLRKLQMNLVMEVISQRLFQSTNVRPIFYHTKQTGLRCVGTSLANALKGTGEEKLSNETQARAFIEYFLQNCRLHGTTEMTSLDDAKKFLEEAGSQYVGKYYSLILTESLIEVVGSLISMTPVLCISSNHCIMAYNIYESGDSPNNPNSYKIFIVDPLNIKNNYLSLPEFQKRYLIPPLFDTLQRIKASKEEKGRTVIKVVNPVPFDKSGRGIMKYISQIEKDRKVNYLVRTGLLKKL